MRLASAPSLSQLCCKATRSIMSDELSQRILTALARMPHWLRRDLSSKDDANRQRAEDSLSAIIASALKQRADG